LSSKVKGVHALLILPMWMHMFGLCIVIFFSFVCLCVHGLTSTTFAFYIYQVRHDCQFSGKKSVDQYTEINQFVQSGWQGVGDRIRGVFRFECDTWL